MCSLPATITILFQTLLMKLQVMKEKNTEIGLSVWEEIRLEAKNTDDDINHGDCSFSKKKG